MFLAGDLILWSHSITAIGAGLGTVVTNLQVLIVSLLAWLILHERLTRLQLAGLLAVLSAIVMITWR